MCAAEHIRPPTRDQLVASQRLEVPFKQSAFPMVGSGSVLRLRIVTPSHAARLDQSLDHVGNAELTLAWRVRKQVMYLYEVDTDAVVGLVPARLEPVEVRPGRSLMAVEALHYHADHFAPGSPEFLELVLAISVQPDLSIDMPVPRFCMHAVSVLSDSLEFVEQEGRLIHTPTVLVPGLSMAYSADGASCTIADGAAPILEMTSTHSAPVHEHQVLWGQYCTNEKGLQQGIWRWEGEMFEHMKTGDHGVFHPHPVWRGIDLSRIRGCYRQMMARPDQVMDVRFYHLGELAARAGSRR
jgi:hypothetical protein